MQFTTTRGNISAQALVLSGNTVLRCIAPPLQSCFTALRRNKPSTARPCSSFGRLHPPADTQQWGDPLSQTPKPGAFPPPQALCSLQRGWEETAPALCFSSSPRSAVLQMHSYRQIFLKSFSTPQSAISVINGRREKLGKERGAASCSSQPWRPPATPPAQRWMKLLHTGKRNQQAELKPHPKPVLSISSWVRAPGG